MMKFNSALKMLCRVANLDAWGAPNKLAATSYIY
jgi:hypothetical protein